MYCLKAVFHFRVSWVARVHWLVLLVTGWASWGHGVAAQTPATDYAVEDFLGREVNLDQPARRIVALAPHIVENLFAAGAGEYVVGVVDYSDYPEPAQTITRVGAAHAYSLERILALRPDLVVVWQSVGGNRVLAQLEKLSLPVYVSEPRTLNDVAHAIRDYGVLADTRDQAEASARSYERRVQGLAERYSERPEIRVLYQIWHQPLQTINGDHIISAVMQLCGGRNAFGNAPVIAPKISMEAVISRDPQVIIASGMAEQRPDWLDDWQRWSSLTAVKHDNLFFIPPDILQRHTPRLLDGAQRMCEQLEQARQHLNIDQ